MWRFKEAVTRRLPITHERKGQRPTPSVWAGVRGSKPPRNVPVWKIDGQRMSSQSLAYTSVVMLVQWLSGVRTRVIYGVEEVLRLECEGAECVHGWHSVEDVCVS